MHPIRWIAGVVPSYALKTCGLLLSVLLMAGSVWAAPAVAFFYGSNPPWESLQAFDLVVVDPGHVPDAQVVKLPQTELVAYVSVGEVHPSRSYAGRIPAAWLRGENRDWGSRLIDQAAPGWPRFFADSVIGPLWEKGYRSFFLDTLDSYHLFAKTAEEKSRQEAGLVALVKEVKRRYPQAKLIFNRGFEILEQTRGDVAMIAAESLFQGYDAGRAVYRKVPQDDQAWLLAQLKRARDEYGLPGIVIDYVPPAQRELARQTARRIEFLGFIPWVATPDLTSLGVGLVEVMPRRILVVHSPLASEYALRATDAVRYATMPLNHLGYVVEYVNARSLPEGGLAGRYAGVVLWLETPGTAPERTKLAAWLALRVDEGVPVALVNEIGPLLEPPLKDKLGVDAPTVSDQAGPVSIAVQAPTVGLERQPRPHPSEFQPLTISQGRPWLTLTKGAAKQVAAAITPWGGYVMAPYATVTLSSGEQNRWVIDPFAFFRESLRLPLMPVPDVTTESGRRMLMVHMDGDGFVSRSELPGNPFAGEVVRDRVVRKYRLPMTLSVIEAELSPQGLYPQLSGRLEAVAREIFSEPQVEIASHSYSHPFNWRMANRKDTAEGYHLNIPGYKYDLQREIEGSVHYVQSRLAPAGKKVAMFLWTGDCIPGRDALAWTQKVGVLNMNGGDTLATHSNPTLTSVEGLGIERNGLFQVFAPNQNENVYTNNWTGPFYGFERVLETFEFTEKPRRLKPVDVYFHTYLVTKPAGLKSLDKVFDWVRAQELTPVFASDYARKVEAFRNMAVATTSNGWRIRGDGNLRTVRLPSELGFPNLRASQSVAGFNQHEGETFVHLSGPSAELRVAPQPMGGVRLISANAAVESAERTEDGFRWNLAGHVPLRVTLVNAQRCRVRAGGRDLVPVRGRDGQFHYQLNTHAARPFEAICRN